MADAIGKIGVWTRATAVTSTDIPRLAAGIVGVAAITAARISSLVAAAGSVGVADNATAVTSTAVDMLAAGSVGVATIG